MLLIPCPYCGQRDESEFSYGGARRVWPDHDLEHNHPESGLEHWHNALYVTPNPAGPLREIWYHGGGCERWIEITRDTVTHVIKNDHEPKDHKGKPS